MAAQTGRTTQKFIYVIVADSGDTLREIPVDSIGDVGLTYEPQGAVAWQDAVKSALSGQPSAKIKITGPFDTSAAVAAPTSTQAHALSGSHTVLNGINGDNKPHTLAIAFGMRQAYTTGEPCWYLQRATATNSGYTCTNYTVNGDKYSAEFDVLQPGAVAPAWYAALPTAGS